jgi:cyclase
MKKQTVVRSVVALIAAGGFWVGLTQQPDPSLKAEQIRPDAHVILGGGGNVGVFVTEEGVVLVDDKFERHVPEILEKVKAITDQPVRYVFNTHHHSDHVGGNPTLLKSTEIIAHRNARENMLKNSQSGLPRVTFRKQTSVFLGGQEIRAYYFGRGHTDGDAVIYYPGQKVIHSGDLFIRASPYIDYSAGGSALEWDKTLAAILQLDFDTVIPGHGPVAKREDLVRWKKDFETVRTRVRQLRQQGRSVEQIEKQLKLDDLAGWSMTGLLKKGLPGLYEELAP